MSVFLRKPVVAMAGVQGCGQQVAAAPAKVIDRIVVRKFPLQAIVKIGDQPPGLVVGWYCHNRPSVQVGFEPEFRPPGFRQGIDATGSLVRQPGHFRHGLTHGGQRLLAETGDIVQGGVDILE